MQYLAFRSLGDTILKNRKQSCTSRNTRHEYVFNSGLYFYINTQIQKTVVKNVLGTSDRPFKAQVDDIWDFPTYRFTFFILTIKTVIQNTKWLYLESYIF